MVMNQKIKVKLNSMKSEVVLTSRPLQIPASLNLTTRRRSWLD